jgi:hypothetical protein
MNPERARMYDELGARRAQARADLLAVNEQISAAVRQEPDPDRGVWAEIARRTGLTREAVAKYRLPPGQRWARTTKKTPAKRARKATK